MNDTRILLVDDHQMVREGLKALLEKQEGLEVTGEAEDGRAAVKMVEKLNPDLVVMDVTMPGLNGIEATRQITKRFHNVKILALSMHKDDRFVLEMLDAGAAGYTLKSSAFQELAEAIRAVLAGEIYLSPRIASQAVQRYLDRGSKQVGTVVKDLTKREREVLQLVTEGGSSKEIAAQLHLSAKTIEVHRQNIMDKLGIRTVAELTKYAIRQGLTSLEH